MLARFAAPTWLPFAFASWRMDASRVRLLSSPIEQGNLENEDGFILITHNNNQLHPMTTT
jgi:hypothetical protein